MSRIAAHATFPVRIAPVIDAASLAIAMRRDSLFTVPTFYFIIE